MEIAYRPGKENPRADALSRREQDMPEGVEDTRISRRFLQIFRPVMADSIEEEGEEEEEVAVVVIGNDTQQNK